MSAGNDGGPAWPCTTALPMGKFPPAIKRHPGMTLRDVFAGQALAGMMADKNPPWAFEAAAKAAYAIADAMLKAREARP